jgi:hypothetical protein
MNYETAKQLKDAGFPQAGSGRWFIEGYKIAQVRVSAFPEPKGIKAYEPTLEELIEACGRPFWLESNVGFEGDVWLAGKNIGPGEKYGKGATPTEAVALLWLNLNKV